MTLNRILLLIMTVAGALSMAYADENETSAPVGHTGGITRLQPGGHPDRAALRTPGQAWVVWSAVWCGPCRAMDPLFDPLVQHRAVQITKVDADQFRWLAPRRDVVSLPHVQIYRNGMPLGVVRRGMRMEELVRLYDAVEALADRPADAQAMIATFSERGQLIMPEPIPAETTQTAPRQEAPAAAPGPVVPHNGADEPEPPSPNMLPLEVAEALASVSLAAMTWVIPASMVDTLEPLIPEGDRILVYADPTEHAPRVMLWSRGERVWMSPHEGFIPVEARIARNQLVVPHE